MTVLLALLAGHALADFALQSDAMAKGKNRHIAPQVPPGQTPQTVWPYWLLAHAAIHGLVVGLITGVPLLGLAEFVLHGATDAGKCEGWYGIHVDQATHVVAKVMWWGMV